MADKLNALSSMTVRQKVTAGIVVVVVLIVIWQLYGLLGGGSEPASVPTPKPATPSAKLAKGGTAPNGAMQPEAPKQADIMQARPLTPTEAMLLKMQQETQASYLAALNQLQMLRVQRDIANTNKDIATARLATVTSEKKIVDMLSPPAPPPLPAAAAVINKAVVAQSAGVLDQEVRYTVVSVSNLQSRWSAILSYKGNLYSVRTGDLLAPDGSRVLSISSDGVTLQKNGVRTKLPLVTSI
jgi:hypothetical protein